MSWPCLAGWTTCEVVGQLHWVGGLRQWKNFFKDNCKTLFQWRSHFQNDNYSFPMIWQCKYTCFLLFLSNSNTTIQKRMVRKLKTHPFRSISNRAKNAKIPNFAKFLKIIKLTYYHPCDPKLSLYLLLFRDAILTNFAKFWKILKI